MTIKELREFIKDCTDNDFVTICTCRDDNPVKDYCDVELAYKIEYSNDPNSCTICLMPT
jgi:hypothetical protein